MTSSADISVYTLDGCRAPVSAPTGVSFGLTQTRASGDQKVNSSSNQQTRPTFDNHLNFGTVARTELGRDNTGFDQILSANAFRTSNTITAEVIEAGEEGSNRGHLRPQTPLTGAILPQRADGRSSSCRTIFGIDADGQSSLPPAYSTIE